MRHHDNASVLAAQRVHAIGNDLEGVNVEAGIGLVENAQFGLEHRHLENLVALLFAPRKSFVHRTRHQLFVHLQQLHLLAYQREEVHGVVFSLAAVFADRVQRRAQEISIADPGYLHRVLEG